MVPSEDVTNLMDCNEIKQNSIIRIRLYKKLKINRIRKRKATCFGLVMRREKLEHLVTTGTIEGKRSRVKQREKIWDGLTK